MSFKSGETFCSYEKRHFIYVKRPSSNEWGRSFRIRNYFERLNNYGNKTHRLLIEISPICGSTRPTKTIRIFILIVKNTLIKFKEG